MVYIMRRRSYGIGSCSKLDREFGAACNASVRPAEAQLLADGWGSYGMAPGPV